MEGGSCAMSFSFCIFPVLCVEDVGGALVLGRFCLKNIFENCKKRRMSN